MTVKSSPMDTISDADVITAVPPSGTPYARWEERVFQARLASLRQVADLCPERIPADEFESFSAGTQQRMILTPEAGRWLYLMKKWLMWGGLEQGEPSRDDLPRQFNHVLLGSYLQEQPHGPVRVRVPLENGCLIPLVSDNAFLKVSTPHGVSQCGVECAIDRTHLTVHINEVAVDRWSISEVRDAVCDEERTTFSMADLPSGIHRLPRLPKVSTVLGLPIGVHYSPCLRRMSGSAEGTSDIEFPGELGSIARDVAVEVERLSETWPDMGSALDSHVRVVVPLLSNTVLSYSESSTPNVVFVRARPLNPLWYTELLLHECAHTWLASLMEVHPLIRNHKNAEYASPWRIDSRPIQGVLFATHAFALVTTLLARHLGRGILDDEILARRIVFEADRVRRGYEVLRKHGEFTAAGGMLVDSLAVHVDEAARASHECRAVHHKSLAAPVDTIWPTVMRGR